MKYCQLSAAAAKMSGNDFQALLFFQDGGIFNDIDIFPVFFH